MTASPMKLKDGSWGARVAGKASAGDIVTVRTKAGKSWSARVTRVVWSGPDKFGGGIVSLCATQSTDGGGRSFRRRAWAPCGYPGCHPSYCDECDGAGLYG